jgi:hypothetical protein
MMMASITTLLRAHVSTAQALYGTNGHRIAVAVTFGVHPVVVLHLVHDRSSRPTVIAIGATNTSVYVSASSLTEAVHKLGRLLEEELDIKRQNDARRDEAKRVAARG